MAQYAPVIELSALDGTNGFVLNGIDANDRSGFSVASAGDVNGDGYDDVIIGAFDADPSGRNDAGESYVVFGKATGWIAALDLAALDGTDGFVLIGIDPDDLSGFPVASAGDVNGDGYDDMIVSAYLADPGGDSEAGESYVVFGKASGWGAALDLGVLDGANGFVVAGIDVEDYSGRSVVSAGDVNGDGYDDVIVGAFAADPGGRSEAGESYVVFGKASGWSAALDLGALDGSNGLVLNGVDSNDFNGFSVASAGDVNGDGCDDVILGAPGADPSGRADAGETYVVFGKVSGWSASLDLSALDGTNGFVINGVDAGDYSGRSVASAGDVNGDGYDDVIVGAYEAEADGGNDAGESYVVFGKATGWSAGLDLGALDGTNGFVLNGVDTDDHSGRSIASAGDVNGDGYDDVIVGADFADPGGRTAAGESYVVFGKATGWSAALDLGALDGNNGFVLRGIDAGDYSGASVDSAGDINGDGLADLIIGAYAAGPGGDSIAGESYVVFGALPGEAVTRIGSVIGQAIHGGAFDDVLSGLGGRDTLTGGLGDDLLLGGDARDILTGGKGSDMASYAGARHGVSVDLSIKTIQNTGEGYDRLRQIENLVGSNEGDLLAGNHMNNRLDGGAGDDTLTGAGRGDRLTGGEGADHFVYLAIGDSHGHADRITDLDAGDVIDLSAIDAVAGGSDDDFKLVDKFTGTGGEARLVYVADRHTTYLRIDIDGDGQSDFQIKIDGDHSDFAGIVL